MTDKTKPRVTVGAVVHIDPSKTTLAAVLSTIPVDKNGNVIMPIGRTPPLPTPAGIVVPNGSESR